MPMIPQRHAQNQGMEPAELSSTFAERRGAGGASLAIRKSAAPIVGFLFGELLVCRSGMYTQAAGLQSG